jgi:SynChlorMet cassette protein ScmC
MKAGSHIRHPSAFILSLADGTRLALCAGDEIAARVLDFLARAAELSLAPGPLPPGVRRLLVVTDTGRNGIPARASDADAVDDIVFSLKPTNTPRPRSRKDPAARSVPFTAEQWLWQQLVRLSACIARERLPRGGVLLHSGLAAHSDLSGFRNLTRGVLLAGRSGVGKSTASQRLPSPWRALADDATLIVRDGQGSYWAHPWPTWSRFFGDEAGDGSDTWDVQQAVPLQAIIVLEQGPTDRIEPLGPGHAIALLTELARQTSTHYLRGQPPDEIAAFNLQRFENLCALVRALPAYLLLVSLDGAFWKEIERVILSPDPNAFLLSKRVVLRVDLQSTVLD